MKQNFYKHIHGDIKKGTSVPYEIVSIINPANLKGKKLMSLRHHESHEQLTLLVREMLLVSKNGRICAKPNKDAKIIKVKPFTDYRHGEFISSSKKRFDIIERDCMVVNYEFLDIKIIA